MRQIVEGTGVSESCRVMSWRAKVQRHRGEGGAERSGKRGQVMVSLEAENIMVCFLLLLFFFF